MVKLYDRQTGDFLGEITEEHLRFLKAQLEEESSEDTDYYLNATTLEMIERAGADPHLVNLLRTAMGEQDEVEFRWAKD